ncbi:malate synthase A [Streptomyces sp. WAC06614]|uniref:malate synthase A n=1 Tax=Streptomyces sp. WAC06614 TaxID=2487416 RepID=UPI000F767249|nr:malate synthase A [Streptomyces sp. WAC06614]RSS84320.1 malate synthase A [Streptomyces sp. WAC06614]
MSTRTPTRRVEVLGPPGERHGEILTPEALEFLARLDAAFANRRREILTARRHRADRLASGSPLGFPRATSAVRDAPNWRVAPQAPGLTDRRVEITSPPTPRMAVHALNSGARVWVADFEDATSPLWENIVGGQLTLLDVCRRRIDFTTPEGKEYRLGTALPAIMVRPRGWHLEEEHLTVDGRFLSASLVDFGLYLFHCAKHRIDSDSGPYFYLPKLENRYEARLWNDVFLLAQDLLGIPRGTIRATAIIETVTAAFEMEEILYELREHSAGLNAGRWDYLFSFIKTFGHHPRFLLPDRTEIAMSAPFMRAYAALLVRTCHRRGAHAIGGVAAHLPHKGPAAGQAMVDKVRLDKEREARDGFDGAWIAHPALVSVCREAFDAVLAGRPHQIHRALDGVRVSTTDLLSVRRSALPPSREEIRSNVSVALRYFDAWLRGRGAVALDGLLEDTATAEIARARLWQWTRHRLISREELRGLIDTESAALAREQPGARVSEAREVLERSIVMRDLPAFFTPEAYRRHLVRRVAVSS